MPDETKREDLGDPATLAADRKLHVSATPAGILLESVRRVRAMKYAVAVAGVAATVAVISAFRLNYSVLVIGSLFTIALMYVVLSFARYASQPARLSRKLNAVLAWTFSVLIVIMAVLITTAISFGWPTTLRSLLISSVLPHNEYWKIKVFDFADYGDRAEQQRLGKLLSSHILDELAKARSYAFHEAGLSPVSIIPQRGPDHEAADFTKYAELVPAIVVSGYVHGWDDESEYEFTVRVTAVTANGLEPLLNLDGRLRSDSVSLRNTAAEVARKISTTAQNYSKVHAK